MFIVGLDLGKRKSWACIGRQDGTVEAVRRVLTTKNDLARLFAPYMPCRILVEASTSAEWVARGLEECGHEVIVGDPRFSLMYAQADKRIKTDRRDCTALFHANRLGAYHHAHRRSDEARDLRVRLLVRAALVRTRTRLAAQLRNLLESRGIVLPACSVEQLVERIDGLDTVTESFGVALLPCIEELVKVHDTVVELDEELTEIARTNPIAARLDKVVGVGPLTALAFVVAVDDPKRFKSAKEVASFFGFVPREFSSGERDGMRGKTTRTGDTLARSYLIQAAWSIRNSTRVEILGLRLWAKSIERRRGAKVAVNALARKLVRILFAMWRDDKDFDVSKFKLQPSTTDGGSIDCEHGEACVP